MRFVVVVVALFAAAGPVSAEVLDRVVAEVGDKPILWSELQTRARMQRPASQAGDKDPQVLHDALSQLIDEQLILQAEPSAWTSPEEVDSAVREIARSNNVTQEQIWTAAEQLGLSKGEYLAELKRQLQVGHATNIHRSRTNDKSTAAGSLESAQKQWLVELRKTSYFAILPGSIASEAKGRIGAVLESVLQQAACSPTATALREFVPPAPAAATTGPIKRFVLLGSTSGALNAALTAEAAALDPQRVNQTLRNLWSLARLAQLEARAEQTPTGRQIVYQVAERPPVGALFITGNPPDQPPPRDELKMRMGTAPRPGWLTEDAQLLRTHYQQRGYADAMVRPGWLASGSEIAVCFTITPGRRTVLKEIVFRGNQLLSSALLQTVLPPPGATNGLGGIYDKEGLAEALQRITALGYDRGMINVRVDEHTEPLATDGFRLVVEINEGGAYTLDSAVLVGVPPPLRAQLEALLALQPGELFNRSRLLASRDRGLAFLAAHGYPDSQLDIATEIKVPQHSIKLTLSFIAAQKPK